MNSASWPELADSVKPTTTTSHSDPININNNINTMDCLPPTADAAAPIPRRNLSEAFEELYVSTPSLEDGATAAATPGMKLQTIDDDDFSQKVLSSNLISPTGVTDLHHADASDSSVTNKATTSATAPTIDTNPVAMAAPVEGVDASATTTVPCTTLPNFLLHEELQKDLSQAVINRVSFYGVIHDINKEATAMAANDDSGLMMSPPTTVNTAAGGEDDGSPLVEAVKGPSDQQQQSVDTGMVHTAVICEERWLLSAIEWRGSDENCSIQACPPTFLQAMGEREYENPLTSLSSGSRTQLWKPSRSWWEAKSGKNPWIEPKSHNKRWRYLWPLIHYHKFLAKCIKKLKRNLVDVKQSVSPVAAFLREEVCAVSDHLAAVSVFDSDGWMNVLQHFSGWSDTTPQTESTLRVLIGQLNLRPLAEHGDVDSPLLRSQIASNYLLAMAAQRSQMDVGLDMDRAKRNGSKHPHSVNGSLPRGGRGPPLPPQPQKVPSQVGVAARGAGVRRPRYGYNYYPQPWYHPGWHQGHYQHPVDDAASVHSTLSTEYSEQYGMYPAGPHDQHYYPPMYAHPYAQDPAHAHGQYAHPHGAYAPNMQGGEGMYPMSTPYHPEQAGLGYFGQPPVDPGMAYGMPLPEEAMTGGYGMPPRTPQAPSHGPPSEQQQNIQADNGHAEALATDHHTPYKYDPSQTPNRSPYWAHLDSTVAMGLSTPQTHIKENQNHRAYISPEEGADPAGANGAQPLLLRQNQYYGYGQVNNYGPPSPATQFMMSPQQNFAMNYGYGYSPNQQQQQTHVLPSHSKQTSPKRGASYRKGTNSSSLKRVPLGLFPAASDGAKSTPIKHDRQSPSTVETIAESDALSESA